MLYFSEIFGKKVFDNKGQYLGKLQDMFFLPIETPMVTKVVIKDNHNKEIVAPANLLKKYNGKGFVMTHAFEPQKKKADEASILKNVQDKQILDLDGEKIIRANDVAIQDNPGYAIAGIDISALGVFRWIGIAKIAANILRNLGIQHRSEFLPWNEIQPIEATRGKIVVKQEKEKLKKLQPEDLADYLEQTTTVNALEVLKLMDPELSARVIADINTGFQSELFRRFSAERAAEILSIIDPDEAVDILLTLDVGKRAKVLARIDEKKKKPIVHLMRHAKTSIGHLMNSDCFTISATSRVKTVISQIKNRTEDFSDLLYIYALNKEDQLVGVVSLHDLVIQSTDAPLYKVMIQNVVIARLTTPKEIAIQKMLKYHLHALPIVDEDRKVLGIVSLADIAETLLENVIETP